MSITFEQALSQLQAMFPLVENDVIVAVLESNGGQMQHTISQLLELAPDSSSAAPAPAPGGSATPHASATGPSGGRTHTDSNHFDVDDEDDDDDDDSVSKEDTPSSAPPTSRPSSSRRAVPAAAPTTSARAGQRRWRHPLPDDFLQVPGRGKPAATSTPADIVEQDAMLAQMMENELFLQELRRHPDFAEYLEAEEEFFHHQYAASVARGTSLDARRRQQRQRRQQARPDGPSLSQKVAAMGGEMRRKFNTFARSFASRFGKTNNRGGEAKTRAENTGLLAAENASDSEDESGLVGGSHARPRGDELAPATHTQPPRSGNVRSRAARAKAD